MNKDEKHYNIENLKELNRSFTFIRSMSSYGMFTKKGENKMDLMKLISDLSTLQILLNILDKLFIDEIYGLNPYAYEDGGFAIVTPDDYVLTDIKFDEYIVLKTYVDQLRNKEDK